MKPASDKKLATFPTTMPSDDYIAKVRGEFTLLHRTVHDGKPLIYLDSAATTPVPLVVQQRLASYYSMQTSNIHRGVHHLSVELTKQFEEARKRVQKFINAKHVDEIVFTHGATMGINLLAQSICQQLPDDSEIMLTQMEHHSNIVPWQLQRRFTKKYLPMTASGDLDMSVFQSLLSSRTKFIGIVYASNSIGTVNDLSEILNVAKQRGITTLVDAAQAVVHMQIDVQKLDCDYLVFSGHKLFAPTGTGVLYGKRAQLHSLPAVIGGGGSIMRVTLEGTDFLSPPARFEAGTPNIAGVLGFDSALQFFMNLNRPRLWQHEQDLLAYATVVLREIKGLRIIGTAENKVSIISFVVDGIHPHDLGTVLDLEGVAVRAGHHCTQPTMQHFNVPATVRVSLAFYNTREEIDILVRAIHKAIKVFK